VKAILEMGHFPVGMEMFNAANEDQWQIICEHIDKSDYYILISAHRYGSTKNNISFTEREYDYAMSQGIPILSFILHHEASWPASLMDRDPSIAARLAQFHAKVKQRYTNFWFNSADLHAKVLITLANTIISHPRPGWIRTNDLEAARHSQDITQLLARKLVLREELEAVEAKLQATQSELESEQKKLGNVRLDLEKLSSDERRRIYEAEVTRIQQEEKAEYERLRPQREKEEREAQRQRDFEIGLWRLGG